MARLSAGQASLQFAFMVKAIGQGLSANKAIQALRDAGMAIGRDRGLRYGRDAKALIDQMPIVAGLDWGNPVDRTIPTAWPSKNKTGYGYVVRIAAVNNATGKRIEVYHTTYTDTLITPQEAVNNAFDAYSEPRYADEFTMEYGAVNNVLQYQPEAG